MQLPRHRPPPRVNAHQPRVLTLIPIWRSHQSRSLLFLTTFLIRVVVGRPCVRRRPGNPRLSGRLPRRNGTDPTSRGSQPRRLLISCITSWLGAGTNVDSIDIYFQHVHPSFPILNEGAFRSNRRNDALVSAIITICGPYFRLDPRLEVPLQFQIVADISVNPLS